MLKKILVGCFALSLFSQDMRVVPIEQQDAVLLRSTYESMQEATRKFRDADAYVRRKYGLAMRIGKEESAPETVGAYSEHFDYLIRMGSLGDDAPPPAAGWKNVYLSSGTGTISSQ